VKNHRINPARPPVRALADTFGGAFVTTTEPVGRGAVIHRVHRNGVYQVLERDVIGLDGAACTHLSIKRVDGATVRDWRHLQRLKNILCGPEREAVEIFPAESRLVDTANQFHLWVLPEGQRVPFGYERRLVSDGDVAPVMGGTQRPFEAGQRPADAVSAVEMFSRYQRQGAGR
jgi:hypothetical protein